MNGGALGDDCENRSWARRAEEGEAATGPLSVHQPTSSTLTSGIDSIIVQSSGGKYRDCEKISRGEYLRG
jgi:hypothetical protein